MFSKDENWKNQLDSTYALISIRNTQRETGARKANLRSVPHFQATSTYFSSANAREYYKWPDWRDWEYQLHLGLWIRLVARVPLVLPGLRQGGEIGRAHV